MDVTHVNIMAGEILSLIQGIEGIVILASLKEIKVGEIMVQQILLICLVNLSAILLKSPYSTIVILSFFVQPISKAKFVQILFKPYTIGMSSFYIFKCKISWMLSLYFWE